MAAPTPSAAVAARAVDARDWVGWYHDLSGPERRELRNRLLTAPYEEVKADEEMRTFFLFHSEDLAGSGEPGTERLAELHHIVHLLRGATEEELVAKRRKAVAFLLAEYQRHLRDNPWAC